MRLINVKAPQGKGATVAQTAFSVEIESVSVYQAEQINAQGSSETKDIVSIETSTPKAKMFIDRLLASDYYNSQDYSFSTRSPLSIAKKEDFREITKPLPENPVEILEELFQFSHITYSFVGRIFLAGCLLAHGMIQQQLLIMVAGLLFLPLLPLLQAVGFGLKTHQYKLSVQGATAFLLAIFLLVVGGIIVASLSSPPLRYNELSSVLTGLIISLAVGIASGLAIIDDTGKREMIGLAASSQIAIIPVWLGICLIFGLPAGSDTNDVLTHILSLIINSAAIIIGAVTVHIFTGVANGNLTHLKEKK
jgi:hypothetical protein